jgi:hypothetical protein
MILTCNRSLNTLKRGADNCDEEKKTRLSLRGVIATKQSNILLKEYDAMFLIYLRLESNL